VPRVRRVFLLGLFSSNLPCRPDCLVDLGPNCPSALQGPFDSTGYALGCKSACEVDPDPQNSPNCCSGAYNTAATCPSVNVQYYSYFSASRAL
jgi:hypothetical protein